jgi:hypothetical protein
MMILPYGLMKQKTASPLTSVAVYNLNGDMVMSKLNVKELNASSLPSGVYFVKSGYQTDKFFKK